MKFGILGNASLFTKFLFTIFVPLDPPPPNQQSDGFPLGFLLKAPETELRTLSQNCEQTLQKLRTNRIMNKRAFPTFAAAKRLVKSGVKFVVKNSGRFRASFPVERGAAKFYQKFHGIFHGNFHAQFQEKFSRQHFCTPCRDEVSGTFDRMKNAAGLRRVWGGVTLSLRVLSATLILSKNSRVLDAKSRLKSAKLS